MKCDEELLAASSEPAAAAEPLPVESEAAPVAAADTKGKKRKKGKKEKGEAAGLPSISDSHSGESSVIHIKHL